MSKTLNQIIANNLCTGCGVCVSESSSSLSMSWNDEGFLVPKIVDQQVFDKVNTSKVCPFNFKPELIVKDEDSISNIFLKDATNWNDKVGKFVNSYVGYSKEFRETSSSGGIGTYIFQQLLHNKIVDYLFIVKEVSGTYQYQLINNSIEITSISKTRYIPVTMEELFLKINELDGKVAVSGVACFIKAIRLKQFYNPLLLEKIPFLIGIICGGLKSKYFTDFLAQSAGIEGSYKMPEYRVKDRHSSASDYSFSAYDESHDLKLMKMSKVGDMWGTGLFKSNACDFCTDVLTELADISLGDAWLPEYRNDGLGNSVIITRSKVADQLVIKGIQNNSLYVHNVEIEKIIESQKSSFSHRHDGLKFRIIIANILNKKVPAVRTRVFTNTTIFYKIVQIQRRVTRHSSLRNWMNVKNALEFNQLMRTNLKLLRFFTRIYHKLK